MIILRNKQTRLVGQLNSAYFCQIIMKKKHFINITILIFFFLNSAVLFGQFFPNASFEGPAPMEHVPPPGWTLCEGTPDTQPMAWLVEKMPSEGVSYVGMCWSSSISYAEMITTMLNEPFLEDSCYLFEIDLCFYDSIIWYGETEINYPITIQIYGGEDACNMSQLIWESPYVEHYNWLTYSFTFEPEFDFEFICIRTHSVPNPLPWPENIGYILMDNIQITEPPPLDLGQDTVLCYDTLVFCANEGFSSYLWQDGSTDTCFTVTEPGIYWVEAFTDYECSRIDSIVVEEGFSYNLAPDSTIMICQGDSVQLNAGDGFESYLWNTGSEDSTIYVYETGIYSVTVENDAGCEATDSVYVEQYPPPETALGLDTLICESGTLTLDAGSGFASYLWNDNSTEQSNIIDTVGTFWVTVEDENGCLGTDTISVELAPPVYVSLGSDTTICNGDEYDLSPGTGYSQYLWQNGSTETSLTVSVAGTYWVQVSNEIGCIGTDSVSVSLSPSPEIFLGVDTTICEGESLTLDVGNSYASYLWQDNSTSSSYYVYESGNYSVTVTNYYDCPGSDEIFVDIGSPEISLGPDSSICYHDSIYLRPGDNFAYYQWQDGSNSQTYHVTTSGMYSVYVADEFGCSDEDNVEIILVWAPEVDLGADQTICSGETITLEAPVGPYTYFWNGEEGTATYQVSKGGICTIQMLNMCGEANDSIYIEEIKTPEVYLGKDILLNPDESIELDAGVGYDSYLWQDGSVNQFLLVTSDNINTNDPNYYVEVTSGPCKGSDTLEVILFVVELPTVFTPNNDGKNDLFLPMDQSWNGVTSHHIAIFNRWGEQVWESDHFEDGWNGKQNGKIVADGTYFWVLELYYGPDNIKQSLKGNVTVLGANN